MRTLNLGILAHVDAGKTSLTERLLFEAGVIAAVGRVDDGTTQTDTLDLERQRGITIRAAVVSFVVDDVTVNLIDTPGHPDFIAEVERTLGVLDAAVLVVSAVEGVQAQTRVLFAALQRLRIPTVVFVNKVDRRGARDHALLADLRTRLGVAAIVLGDVVANGTPAARFVPFAADDAATQDRWLEVLAGHDDAVLADWVAGSAPSGTARQAWVHAALVAQVRAARVQPVLFGSAISGTGVVGLMGVLAGILAPPPSRAGWDADAAAPLSATVFKIERTAAGERTALVRVFAGALAVRGRVACAGPDRADFRTVTAIRAFERGGRVPVARLGAGRIGAVSGLGDVRIGDILGVPPGGRPVHRFPPPTLATVVVPRLAADRAALHHALLQMADEDPLIDLQADPATGDLHLALFGEVQKEVIGQTVLAAHGLDVAFRATSTICIERPVATGAAVEGPPRPFVAHVGLRVEPGPPDSGVAIRLDIPYGSLPLAFHRAVEDGIHEGLARGLHGWRVTDCVVTVTHAIRYRDWGNSTAADHRLLAPLVLVDALRAAGSQVCEPVHRVSISVPPAASAAVLALLGRAGAQAVTTAVDGAWSAIEAHVAAARVDGLRRALPGVGGGEGVLEARFDHWRPVRGEPPERAYGGHDARNRRDYLARVAGSR